MDDSVKKLVMGIILIAVLIFAGFMAVKIYNAAVEDATKRIKQGVTEGVEEGVGGAMNPIKLPGKILGFGRN